MKPDALEAQLDLLLEDAKTGSSLELQKRLHHGALTILLALYGPDSSHEKELRSGLETLLRSSHPLTVSTISASISVIRGALEGVRADLKADVLGSIRSAVTAEVLTDFVALARTVLEKKGDDAKNVSAVLAAAAFEDSLRRLASQHSLPSDGRLADLLASFKAAGIIQGAQVGVAQSYLSFRNRALHAKWDELDRPEVLSVLAFTEQLVLKHFT